MAGCRTYRMRTDFQATVRQQKYANRVTIIYKNSVSILQETNVVFTRMAKQVAIYSETVLVGITQSTYIHTYTYIYIYIQYTHIHTYIHTYTYLHTYIHT